MVRVVNEVAYGDHLSLYQFVLCIKMFADLIDKTILKGFATFIHFFLMNGSHFFFAKSFQLQFIVNLWDTFFPLF